MFNLKNNKSKRKSNGIIPDAYHKVVNRAASGPEGPHYPFFTRQRKEQDLKILNNCLLKLQILMQIRTIKFTFLLLLAAKLCFGQSQECLPGDRTFPENNDLDTKNVFGLTGTFSGELSQKSCSETNINRTLIFDPDCSNGTPTITSFLVEGGLQLVSQSGSSVTIKPISEPGVEYPRYNKGRITADYTCSYDTTVQVSVPCLNDSTIDYTYTVSKEGRSYVDLYQEFDWNAPIIGPVCVTEGERVTYSIFDYVSGTSNSGLGIDDYKWCFPSNWDLAYFFQTTVL
jgi:hypothetical protein